ncbi:MAG: hypothetical protein M3Q65_00440, partial [Chloroflexota bacterium]|nr:hypothetical protein [Chloroflexota bacterium]
DDGPRANGLIATLAADAERVTRDERDRARSAAGWLTAREEIDVSAILNAGSADGDGASPAPRPLWEEQASSAVYRRLVRGPLGLHWGERNLSPGAQDRLRALLRRPGARTVMTMALTWIDGRRTLLEVADLVEAETGLRDLEILTGYAALLEDGRVLERVPITTPRPVR